MTIGIMKMILNHKITVANNELTVPHSWNFHFEVQSTGKGSKNIKVTEKIFTEIKITYLVLVNTIFCKEQMAEASQSWISFIHNCFLEQ